MVSRTRTRVPGVRCEGAGDLVAEVHRVGVPERRGEEDDEDARDLCRLERPADSGAQLVVPGMRPSTCSCGRALRRMRSRMASPTATPMPCSTPTSDHREQRHRGQAELEEVEAGDGDADRAGGRAGCATKIKMAASVARGTSLSTSANGMSRTMTSGRPERAGLGPAAGRDDGAGARRAGVDRERAHQPGHARCRRRRRGSRGPRPRRSRPARRRPGSWPRSGSRRRAPPRRPAAPGSRAWTTTARSARGAGAPVSIVPRTATPWACRSRGRHERRGADQADQRRRGCDGRRAR